MLVQLFQIEILKYPRVLLRLKVARDPGQRAKIAVKSKDARMIRLSMLVQVKSSRNNPMSLMKRVDIVLWDDNPAQLVINAMAPAEVEFNY